jgi:hypothetical protein
MKRGIFRTGLFGAMLTGMLIALPAAGQGSSPTNSSIPPEPMPFGRGAFVLEYARSYPQLLSEDKYLAGNFHPVFGYRRVVDADWTMGVAGHYRSFIARDGGEEVPILHFSHETLRTLRLWHPVYLLGGFKWFYMLPVREQGWPIKRRSDIPSQIGVGLTASLAVAVTPRWQFLVRLERWRGTANQRIQGVDVAAGVAWSYEGAEP